ncbi:MAG TPA: tetratricopeptide repeat protein [Caulobacteraceae bacterium]|nr:tetratricopeptide repeat protein [Caulobacteraceae bacterium]
MSRQPSFSASERPATISEALDRAVSALQAGRAAEAERLAGYVLTSNRGHAQAAQILGQALLLQGRAAEAIGALQSAARRSRDPILETLLARALAEVGRRDEALDQLRLATTRRPPYPQAFLELGDQLGAADQFDEAISVFEAGLALAPEASVLRIGLGYIHLHRNDRARARSLFAQVRAEAPGRRDACVALAAVLSLDGDYAAAAELYRQALELRPDDPSTRISLAKCLVELGDRVVGEAVLRAASRTGGQAPGLAITALAATARGRLFLRPSAASRFLSAGAA